MKTNVYRHLAVALVTVLIVAACQSATEVESVVDESAQSTEDRSTENTDGAQNTDRASTSQVEPTAVQAPAATAAPEPTPLPTAAEVPPAGIPTPTGADDPVVISPEAPLPARRLCTDNVDLDEELNLRAAPSLDAPIIFGIPGQSCRMSERLPPAAVGWMEVVYETQNQSIVGFVSTDFVVERAFDTLAFNWFDRVVAEQDTAEMVYQPWLDEAIARHPFPAGAYRAVPFDEGTPWNCLPIGDTTVGCPMHVLDSAGELITPMLVMLAVVGFDGYDASYFPDDFGDEPLITGFELCIGTEDCPDFTFTYDGQIVVDDSRSLAGVVLGTPAEEAVDMLSQVFGTPTEDTGWVVGCPLDGDGVNERAVSWGSLQAGFRRFDDNPTAGSFDHWSYWLDEDRNADGRGPQPADVRLPNGTAIGMNITIAGEQLAVEPFENEVLQLQQLNSESWTMYGSGLETDTRINGVGVPFVPLCD